MSYALIWNPFTKTPTKKSTVIKISSNLVQENQHNHPFIPFWSNCEITAGMKAGSGQWAHTLKVRLKMKAKEKEMYFFSVWKCSHKAIDQAEHINLHISQTHRIPGLFALKFSTHYHSH